MSIWTQCIKLRRKSDCVGFLGVEDLVCNIILGLEEVPAFFWLEEVANDVNGAP